MGLKLLTQVILNAPIPYTPVTMEEKQESDKFLAARRSKRRLLLQ